jgi:hypothetical protein
MAILGFVAFREILFSAWFHSEKCRSYWRDVALGLVVFREMSFFSLVVFEEMLFLGWSHSERCGS